MLEQLNAQVEILQQTEDYARFQVDPLERGFGLTLGNALRRVLLSHDVCMKSHLRAYGGQGYDYVLTGFVPRLRQAGLSDEQIHTLTVDNPRSALTGE